VIYFQKDKEIDLLLNYLYIRLLMLNAVFVSTFYTRKLSLLMRTSGEIEDISISAKWSTRTEIKKYS